MTTTVRVSPWAAHRSPVDHQADDRRRSRAGASTFVGGLGGCRLRSVTGMRNRLTLLWERIGPRARDIGFIVLAALAAIGPIVFRRDDGAAIYLLTIVT